MGGPKDSIGRPGTFQSGAATEKFIIVSVPVWCLGLVGWKIRGPFKDSQLLVHALFSRFLAMLNCSVTALTSDFLRPPTGLLMRLKLH